jgi:hypothetical protein
MNNSKPLLIGTWVRWEVKRGVWLMGRTTDRPVKVDGCKVVAIGVHGLVAVSRLEKLPKEDMQAMARDLAGKGMARNDIAKHLGRTLSWVDVTCRGHRSEKFIKQCSEKIGALTDEEVKQRLDEVLPELRRKRLEEQGAAWVEKLEADAIPLSYYEQTMAKIMKKVRNA